MIDHLATARRYLPNAAADLNELINKRVEPPFA